jgi:hypothetical protein
MFSGGTEVVFVPPDRPELVSDVGHPQERSLR